MRAALNAPRNCPRIRCARWSRSRHKELFPMPPECLHERGRTQGNAGERRGSVTINEVPEKSARETTRADFTRCRSMPRNQFNSRRLHHGTSEKTGSRCLVRSDRPSSGERRAPQSDRPRPAHRRQPPRAEAITTDEIGTQMQPTPTSRSTRISRDGDAPRRAGRPPRRDRGARRSPGHRRSSSNRCSPGSARPPCRRRMPTLPSRPRPRRRSRRS